MDSAFVVVHSSIPVRRTVVSLLETVCSLTLAGSQVPEVGLCYITSVSFLDVVLL